MTEKKMTPRERLLAAAELRATDRLPLLPYLREFAMKQKGLTFREVDKHPHKYVEAQVEFFQKYDLDGVWDLYFMTPEAEAMGCELLHAEDDAPSVLKSPIKEKKDLAKILPCDPEKDGRLPQYIGIVRELRKGVGPDVPILAFCQGGYRNGVMLRGIDAFMDDIYEDPSFAHEVLEVATEGCIRYGRALIEAGADIIHIASPMASGMFISKKHHLEFAFPYDKKQFQAYHDMGAKVFYHLCGWWNDRWDLILENGADILSIDSEVANVSIAEAKEKMGHKRCIYGNVDVAHTMLKGTVQEVEAATRAAVEVGRKGGGYIIGNSCTIPRDTPLENFEAFIRIAKELRG